MGQNYKNILIFALRKIGDTIIATSVADLLRKAYPTAKISMLVRPLSQDIVNNHPIIDEVILYNYTHSSSFKEMRKIADELKKKSFDLAIVTDNKPRSAMIAWLADIPNRVGFENIELRNVYLKLFYTEIIKIEHDARNTKQVKNHEIFINCFTGRNDRAKMVMADTNQQSKEKVDRFLQQILSASLAKVDVKLIKIALCIRSGCLIKDWPIFRFTEVVEKLNQLYQAVFYVIGSTADVKEAETFQANTKANISILCGQTSLSELAYLLKQSDFFLTVDTGSAHIAAAVEVPMVTIFGGTSPKKWGPYTDQAINLSPDYPCHPCDGTKIKCIEPKCLEKIGIDEVLEACKKQLGKITGEV